MTSPLHPVSGQPGGGGVMKPVVQTENYFAIRLPDESLWDDVDTGGGQYLELGGHAPLRVWALRSSARAQLIKLRATAERLGMAEIFEQAAVIPVTATLTIAEQTPAAIVDAVADAPPAPQPQPAAVPAPGAGVTIAAHQQPSYTGEGMWVAPSGEGSGPRHGLDDGDTVVGAVLVPHRWPDAREVVEGAWFQVPGSEAPDVVWQRRGSQAHAVNTFQGPWDLESTAGYYAEHGGLLEVLDSVAPCLDCGDSPSEGCPRCGGAGKVSR